MVCGFLFSTTSKSSFARSVTNSPFLSVTVNSMSTRVTSTRIREDSSALAAPAAGAAGCCPAAAANDKPAAASATQQALIMYRLYPFQRFHPLRQSGGQRRLDDEFHAGGRAAEANPVGVEKIPAQRRRPLDAGRRAVERIAGDGVADAGEVYADLVRAPGADANFQERKPCESPQDAVLGPCGAPFGQPGGHAGPVDGIAGDGPLDATAFQEHPAMDQRQVDLLHTPSGELGGELAMRGRSEEHTSELQSPCNLVCRLLLEKK